MCNAMLLQRLRGSRQRSARSCFLNCCCWRWFQLLALDFDLGLVRLFCGGASGSLLASPVSLFTCYDGEFCLALPLRLLLLPLLLLLLPLLLLPSWWCLVNGILSRCFGWQLGRHCCFCNWGCRMPCPLPRSRLPICLSGPLSAWC